MTFNRYRAFSMHLLGSLGVALCSAALVFCVWYPVPMAAAAGVTDIYLLLLGVDVVIGPVITLVVFNPAKKELKRDMAVVLLLQLAALTYGIHAVFAARPVYLVYNIDRFDLVYANDLTDAKLRQVSNPMFKSPPVWGPQIIAAQLPKDRKDRANLLFSAATGGDDLPQLPRYYVPYSNVRDLALQRAQSLEKLRQLNATRAAEVDALRTKYRSHASGVGFLPVRGKAEDLTAVVDRGSAQVLEITDLKPWP